MLLVSNILDFRLFEIIQRRSVGGRVDAYSIMPVLKTQISRNLNCFQPALIKDVFKGGKNFSVLASFLQRLCLLFAKMVAITSKGPFKLSKPRDTVHLGGNTGKREAGRKR